MNYIKIKPGQLIETVSTKRLVRGCEIGFNFSMYEIDAVQELIERKEFDALRNLYFGTSLKMTKTAIRRKCPSIITSSGE